MQHAQDLVAQVETDEVRAKILQRIGATALSLEMPLQTVSGLLLRANALAADNAMFGLSSRTLNFLAIAAELYEDDMAQSVWYAQQSVTAAMKAGDRTTLQNALLQLIHIETLRGNQERLVGLEQQFVATATTDAAQMGYIMPTKAAIAAWQGRFDEAARLMATVADSSHRDFDRAFDAAMQAVYLIAGGQRQRALDLAARTMQQLDSSQFAYAHGKRLGEMARLLCAVVEALAGRQTNAARILSRRAEHTAPFVDALREAAQAIARAMKTPALREEVAESLDALAALGYGGVSRILERAVERCTVEAAPAGQIVLTKAEVDVLQALADGRSPKDIALETGRSVNTVQVHIQNVIRKLGCSGRNEALSIARKQGLLP
jgi:DNA-binding NarL/FixJ family response regulator